MYPFINLLTYLQFQHVARGFYKVIETSMALAGHGALTPFFCCAPLPLAIRKAQ